MAHSRTAWLVLPIVLTLGACYAPPPTRVTVVSPPPSPPPQIAEIPPPPPPALEVASLVSPAPPPPSPHELVPPPPAGSGPVTWQPGHWRWTATPGHEWAWVSGNYVERPPDRTAWIVGQWQSMPNGWTWVEGHWQ